LNLQAITAAKMNVGLGLRMQATPLAAMMWTFAQRILALAQFVSALGSFSTSGTLATQKPKVTGAGMQSAPRNGTAAHAKLAS
jgi:hypothetical protein